MAKITALLDAENWTAVDAPDEFQAIVDSWTHEEEGHVAEPDSANGQTADVEPSARAEATQNGAATTAEQSVPPVVNGESYANGTEQLLASKPGSEADLPQVEQRQDGGQGTATEQATGGEPAARDPENEQPAPSSSQPEGSLSRHSSFGALSRTPSETDVTETAPSEPGGSVPEAPRPPPSESTSGGGAGPEAPRPPPAAKRRPRPRTKPIVVRGQEFAAVQSSLMLLKILTDYLDVAEQLPAMATEVVHRVAEILKLFNSRSCQLVLGAGAMQVGDRCKVLRLTMKGLGVAKRVCQITSGLKQGERPSDDAQGIRIRANNLDKGKGWAKGHALDRREESRNKR